LVILHNERDFTNVVTLLLKIAFKVAQRFQIFIHTLNLGIRNEDDSIKSFKDELARSIVNNLAWDGIEMEAGFKTADITDVQRQKIEKQSSLDICVQSN